MATGFSSNDGGSERSTPTRALATLLGVYTALYLAVVGAIHFATSPDAAAAVVPEVTSLHVAVTTLAAEPLGTVGGVPGVDLIDPEGTDNSRECIDGIDTSCIYN
jgi:uncharacterized membrane protein